MVPFLARIVGLTKKKEVPPENIYTRDILKGKCFEIGEFTYGEPVVMQWDDSTRLHIGKYCSIASGVTILLGGNHRTDWVTTYPFNVLSAAFPRAHGIVGHPATKGDIVIGNDVWIGHGATILSGVHIGDGAVVGAHAVVATDVEPYTIVVGNPAKTVRKRFDEDTICALLNIQWWNWSPEKINQEVDYLCSENIQAFIDRNQNNNNHPAYE